MAVEIYEPIFFFFFPLKWNVKHKSQETKRLGHHKCPLSWIKGDREKKNRLDDLERLYLLDSFQDTHFTKSGSKSLLGPFLLSPDNFKTSSLQADNFLWRNCQQTLIHVLCLRMLEILSRAFNSLLRVNWVLWQGTQSPSQATPGGSWAAEPMTHSSTWRPQTSASPAGTELWEADSSAGVWGRRCRALLGDVPLSFKVTHLQIHYLSVQFRRSVLSTSCAPQTAAHQASLCITNSRSLLKLMSIESVMPSSHLILCHPLLLLPSIFPSIRVFSNESVLCIRWPKYWSFSFSISPPKNVQVWFPLGWTGWTSLRSKGLSRVFSNTTVQSTS